MTPPSQSQRLTLLCDALAPFARRLAEQRQIVHIPRLLGLREKTAGLVFHAVPEIFFQFAGANRFTCPAERFTLRTDEIVIMSRWLPHGERFTNGPTAAFSGLVVGLDPGLATFRWQCPGDASRPSAAWSVACAGPSSDQIARYLDDLAASHPASPAFHYSLLHAVVVLMLDLLQPAAWPAEPPGPAVPFKVQRCREIIQAELSDPELGVRRLARDLRCTAGHLSRLFCAEYGVALNAFIRTERLRHAERLLADPSLNVSEVAWACGFRSPNYFIRRFRDEHGATPGEFQRAQSAR
jgi:AraC-like DNA-binding protein